jgi:methionyl-tRNA formyltransferase
VTARDDPARTVFFGSGPFAVPTLEALAASPDVELVGVVSVPDRPTGRRQEPTPTPVTRRARELSLRVLQPTRLRDEATIRDIAALRPDLGVLADYGRIVPATILELPRHGMLNVHPSLLPRHRGASPIPATILAGDTTTGVTLIRMDAGLDTGPIVAATSWPLGDMETAPEVEARAATEGAELVRRTLTEWLAGRLTARPQDEASASLTKPLRRADGLLDPRRPAAVLERQVRAFQPWPGTFVETAFGPLKVWRAETIQAPSDYDEALPPGAFGPPPDLRLGTADGDLLLVEVQPAGGRRMTGRELLLGRPRLAGTRLALTDRP